MKNCLYSAIVVETCGLPDFDIDWPWDSTKCLTYTTLLIPTVSMSSFHSTNLFLFSHHHTPTNSIAPPSAYKPIHNSSNYSDKRPMLHTSAFLPSTVANLHFQLIVNTKWPVIQHQLFSMTEPGKLGHLMSTFSLQKVPTTTSTIQTTYSSHLHHKKKYGPFLCILIAWLLMRSKICCCFV